MVTSVQRPRQRVAYAPRGGAKQLLECRDDEVLLEGPVGTGKSYGLLWKGHLAAMKYPGARLLLARKTQTSLTASAIATFENKILNLAEWGVSFFGGSRTKPPAYIYPNGSMIVVGGFDKASKIMSTEYDLAMIPEATELTLNDWEALTTRMRNGKMPYQQIIADCNPDVPTHWLNVRCNEGRTRRLYSRHKDNPYLWDAEAGTWTERGYAYVVKKLGNLTGVRRKRLLDGIWAAAEGQVYEEWDAELHVIDRFPIPKEWPRVWTIDFGFVHPFVWQAWAVAPDGALIRYREIYMTRRLVEDHAKRILELTKDEPDPIAIITDHDAEDRATLERKLRKRTRAAHKTVKDGIQAVAERLRPMDNGKARLYFMRDSLDERDVTLAEQGFPTCTEDEFGSYVWDLSRGAKEAPVKEFDHGMDATRYTVAHFDLRKSRGMGSV